MAKQPLDRDAVLHYHTQVQGVANLVAELLSEAMSGQDASLLAMLQEKLRPIRQLILRNENPLQSTEEIYNRLQAIHEQITEIQHRGVQNAAEILYEKAELTAKQTSRYTAQEIEAIRANATDIRKKHLKNELTDVEITNMLNYKPLVNGKTIQQWFGDLDYNVSSRIFHSVQKGVIEGMTLNSIIQSIQGSEAGGFKDGIPEFKHGVLKTNRQSAEILARTTINAVANQSRLEMYRENADVIDGVKWLATLDHRTCPICGAYDGKVWKPDALDKVPVPPAHPNCRCVLVPYIDIGEGGTRPAEAENFDLMAREKYEANPNHTKSWDDLSYEYRRQLRYKAIEEYKDSGKEPYKQLKSESTFEDYLKGQPESFQREWLGSGRYELYKTGKLTLEHMVKPDSGFKRTIAELEAAVALGQTKTPSPAAKREVPLIDYDWEQNPLVQEELKKNEALNKSYDLQLQALEARAAAAMTEMKAKFPYMIEKTGEVRDLVIAKKKDRDEVKAIVGKMKQIDDDRNGLQWRIIYDVDMNQQNETILHALFPKLAATNLTDAEKSIVDKFTMLTTAKQKATVEKMLRLCKMFGIDLDQFAAVLKTETLPSNDLIGGSAAAVKNKNGVITHAEVNFQAGMPSYVMAHEFGHIIENLVWPDANKTYHAVATGDLRRVTTFSGRKQNQAIAFYRDMPFSYPKKSDYAQYPAKWYGGTNSTELTSSFFEFLVIDARSLLMTHPEYAKLILAALEK